LTRPSSPQPPPRPAWRAELRARASGACRTGGRLRLQLVRSVRESATYLVRQSMIQFLGLTLVHALLHLTERTYSTVSRLQTDRAGLGSIPPRQHAENSGSLTIRT
jgi:hypothetical protein